MKKPVTNRLSSLALVCALGTALSGCAGMSEKLSRVGQAPELTHYSNPTQQPGYQPVSWPLPPAQPTSAAQAGSLWQPGARAFFRDQRARQIGDILRVRVAISDNAKLDNKTERRRNSDETMGAPNVFGLERKLTGWLPGDANPESLLSINSGTNNRGEGKIDRKEDINTQVAATITQILPNGNFVIEGRQEIRVNFELREVYVSGVVRPEDIMSDNTIDSTQIAEARIVYGGRGQVTDVQQPRYGQQVLEAISPF
jgi:flagellar L-ring protein precursor FlgH